MLSTTADHALRAVLFLARRPERKASADEIADAIGAPPNYLSKILHDLRKAGIVESVAGRQGGFWLAPGSEALSVAQIIDRFDAPPALTRCLLGDRPCNARVPCAAHDKWSAITRNYRAALERTTIAHLAGLRGSSR